jgi:hypothetical protein
MYFCSVLLIVYIAQFCTMAREPKRRNLAAGRVSDELQRLLHTGGISLDGLHTLLRKVEPLRRDDGTLPGKHSILAANADRLLLWLSVGLVPNRCWQTIRKHGLAVVFTIREPSAITIGL